MFEQNISCRLLQFQDAGQSSGLYADVISWKIYSESSFSSKIFRWEHVVSADV